MPAANSIFVSYRRSDSDYVTGHVYERLRSHFGLSIAFKDTDSIPLGVDTREYIKEAIATSQVLIAVIGARWLDALNQRTIEGRKDWVREEIEAALAKGSMPIIPLLVESVQMPIEEDLPESLKALVYRNAAQVRPALDFDRDVDRLIKGLESVVMMTASRSDFERELSDLEQIKLGAWQTQKAALTEKYQAASDQLIGCLSEADKVTIQAQIKTIERELQRVNKDISTLLSK